MILNNHLEFSATIHTSEGVVDIESDLVRVLLFDGAHVEGLLGGNGPVFVDLVGELGLSVDHSTELEHVVHGGLVGEIVLATGSDVHGLFSKSRFSFISGVVNELVGVSEFLLGVVNHASSVNLSVHIGTNPVLVAIGLLHDDNLSVFDFFLELGGGADIVVLLDINSAAHSSLRVFCSPFLFHLPLCLNFDIQDNGGARHVGRFNVNISH